MSNMEIAWVDKERESREPPDPAFPRGIDIDFSRGASPTCTVALPYPAIRCGLYVVTCKGCNQRVALTTAGRPDDPRSVTLACRPSAKPGRDRKPQWARSLQ